VTDSQGPNTPSLEMAHVLFMDMVAYSALHMDRQQQLLHDLQEAVRNTSAFNRAQAEDQLIRLPTGDGMALVFFRNPEAPVRCALELTKILRGHAEIKLRMGIHTGPVYRVADINANRNVAGGGINIAQRVMDCGDAGHILVSSAEAEVLGQVSAWCSMLHDLGEVEVKHGVRIHLYSLHTTGAGNSELPKKISTQRATPSPAATATKSKRLATLTVAGMAFLAVASVGGWLFFVRKAHSLSATDTIVLADFANTTGDPVFDDALRQGLSVQLEQSPFLELVSERKVNETLKLMGRPAGDRLTPMVTREICQRTHSKAMLTGSIAGLGSQFVIGLKAVNCNTGDVLGGAQEQAASKEAVLKALDNAAISLRRKLGESLSSVQKYATPVEEATTPSLEALKAYSLGRKTRFAKGETAALPFYKRAVELDPNFALPYAAMAVAYSNLNEVGRGADNARKAYGLREKVSEPERFAIEGSYYLQATGELEKAAQTYELWEQTYPRDVGPYSNVAFISASLGNWEKTLEETREELRLEPNNVANYLNLGNAYVNLNRLDEAEAVYKQAEDRKLEGELLLAGRYLLAFQKGDAVQMAQLLSAGTGKQGTEDLLLATQADTEGWYGKLKNAHVLTRQAMDSAQHNDAKETAAAYQAAAALREVESGNREQARAEADAALKLGPNRDVRALATLALARAAATPAAEKLAAELDKTLPLDTLVQRYWLPTIRAAVALERKDPKRAIELLKVAGTIELGQPTGLAVYLCPAYLRGEAYLMQHNGSAAAPEFQKFIDHRGLVANFPWGALARLGLARASAMQGNTVKARAAYEDFLTLWKDADPNIPILIAAKAEYAKLH
jgi:class 3 adenylate cyclase/tetratricopeptide (TPR) repeat protein